VRYLTWGGDKGKIALPKDKDSSLLCAEHAAYGIIEDEDKTSFFPLKNDNATPTVAQLSHGETRAISSGTGIAHRKPTTVSTIVGTQIQCSASLVALR